MTEPEIDQLRLKGGYVAGRAQIRDVRAHKLAATLKDPVENFGLSYELQPSVSTAYDESDSEDLSFVIEAEYALQIKQLTRELGDDEEPAPEDFTDLATVEVTVAGLFTLDLVEDDRRPATEEVEAYSRSTGLFALHPYAREQIANLTSRIGLPTLTIGVLHMGTGQVADQ
ncbi:hypothetical protein [Aeromicrobium sp.]|uniref:hypothetical protein n=1 Tax=Aeromicrobium sp. TaxID=1871063 RepID=UPI002FC9DF45